MRTYISTAAFVAAIISTACSGNTLSGPTAAPAAKQAAAVVMTYAINVPETIWTQELQTAHPNGVALSPIAAQIQWDFSCEYAGAANVYYGPTAPPGAGAYAGTSIVIAPATVADELTFTAAEWPVLAAAYPAGTTFTWLGHFVYAAPSGGLQTYGVCPTYVIE